MIDGKKLEQLARQITENLSPQAAEAAVLFEGES